MSESLPQQPSARVTTAHGRGPATGQNIRGKISQRNLKTVHCICCTIVDILYAIQMRHLGWFLVDAGGCTSQIMCHQVHGSCSFRRRTKDWARPTFSPTLHLPHLPPPCVPSHAIPRISCEQHWSHISVVILSLEVEKFQ